MPSGFLGGGIGPRAFGGGGRWYTAGGAPMPVAAYQPKGAASLAASRVNLANPGTYDAADGTAPTFDAATGWTFAASQYLTTGINGVTDAWSMIVRFSGGSTGGDRCLIGSYTPSFPEKTFSLWQITAGRSYYGNYNLLASASYITSGTLAIAGKSAYKNGVADGTIGNGAVDSAEIEIGRNAIGATKYYYNGNIQAIAIYNTTLTAGQVAAVSAAMAAL